MGTTMVIFGTVRANGAVLGPLIILAIGLIPVRLGFALGAYPWLKADALWLSFPVSSLCEHPLAIAFYFHGGWKKSRMERRCRSIKRKRSKRRSLKRSRVDV